MPAGSPRLRQLDQILDFLLPCKYPTVKHILFDGKFQLYRLFLSMSTFNIHT